MRKHDLAFQSKTKRNKKKTHRETNTQLVFKFECTGISPHSMSTCKHLKSHMLCLLYAQHLLDLLKD